jgi:hypothetical protein
MFCTHRYFFHKFAIEDEERKRQQLLQGKLDSPPDTAAPAIAGVSVLPSLSMSSDEVHHDEAITKPANVESSQTMQSIGTTDSSSNSTRISEESYVAVKTEKVARSDIANQIGDSNTAVAKQEGGNDDDDDDSDWE